MFFGMCFVLLGVLYFFMARAAIIISYLLKQEREEVKESCINVVAYCMKNCYGHAAIGFGILAVDSYIIAL